MSDSSLDNSDYSRETMELANDLFFVIVEQEEVTPEVIKKFEYVTAKKYSFGLLNYAKYMMAPDTLRTQPPADLEAHVIKAFHMLMMVSLKQDAAYDDDFEETLGELSPRLLAYQGNARNKKQLRRWRNPNQTGCAPRILQKLICAEAKAFVRKWQTTNIKTPVVYQLPHRTALLTYDLQFKVREIIWQRPCIP